LHGNPEFLVAIMSRGAGRIERALRTLLAAEPTNAFSLADLATHIFPDVRVVQKKHRVSLRRAALKIIASDPDWRFEQTHAREVMLVNAACLESRALAQLNHAPRGSRRFVRHFLPERQALVEDRRQSLAPGEVNHHLLAPGSDLQLQVAEHIARRDGDAARADAIARERQALEARLASGGAVRRRRWYGPHRRRRRLTATRLGGS
jgi:hypothetical protein